MNIELATMSVGDHLRRLCPWRRVPTLPERPPTKAMRETEHALLVAEATSALYKRDVEALHRVLDAERQVITGNHHDD